MAGGETANPSSSGKQKEEETEVDVFLGDGFSVVDDVSAKEDESQGKADGAEAPVKKENPEAAKGDGGADKKAEASVKKEEEAKKETEPSSVEDKSDKSTTKTAANTKAKVVSTASGGNVSQKSDAIVEKSSSESKDANSSIPESKEDSLLITAEEDIDVAEKETTEKKEKEPAKDKSSLSNGTSSRPKMKVAPSMWVSNIARRIKATDLKRIFSKHGRVITAKIVTNGQSYFGYVCMDSKKSIEHCIKHLNNTKLGDKKISISSERPDAPKRPKSDSKRGSSGATAKQDDKSDTVQDAKDKGKKIDAANEKKTEGDSPSKKKEDSSGKGKPAPLSEKRRSVKERLEIPKIDDELFALRKECKQLKRENETLRRGLSELKRKQNIESIRSRRFERFLNDAEDKIREERKKFEKERDILLKKNRLEQSKLGAERDILEKERMDLKRKRDDLEHEMRRFDEMQRAAAAERSHRSNRKSRSISPRMNNSNPKRFKSSNELKHESKKARWSGDRTRTPPPPPKLTAASEPRGKRDPDHFYDERPFRREVPVYVPPGEFPPGREGRHSRGGVPPETKSAVVVPSRSSTWSSGSNNIPSSQWRPGSSSELPAQYSEGRYREHQPYRTSGSYPDPPRNEIRPYPEFRRPVHYEAPARKY